MSVKTTSNLQISLTASTARRSHLPWARGIDLVEEDIRVDFEGELDNLKGDIYLRSRMAAEEGKSVPLHFLVRFKRGSEYRLFILNLRILLAKWYTDHPYNILIYA